MTKLEDVGFFQKLSPDELEKLKSISTQKLYKKGEILFYEGDEPEYLQLLLQGSLTFYKTTPKSQQIYLHQLMAVNFIAELANFENIPYPATAEFITDGEVLKIDYEQFLEEIISNKSMSLSFIKSLSNKFKIVSDVLHKELILTSEAKIAKFIVENPDIFNMTKNIRVASILNITPETLSRILSTMKKGGLIEIDKQNKLTFVDEKNLKKIYL